MVQQQHKTAEELAAEAQEAAEAAEDKETKKAKFIAAQKEKTKCAVEDEKTGKRVLTGVVQQTPLYRKNERGRMSVVAGGKTEFSKRKEGKSAQNNIISVNKKRKEYAS